MRNFIHSGCNLARDMPKPNSAKRFIDVVAGQTLGLLLVLPQVPLLFPIGGLIAETASWRHDTEDQTAKSIKRRLISLVGSMLLAGVFVTQGNPLTPHEFIPQTTLMWLLSAVWLGSCAWEYRKWKRSEAEHHASSAVSLT